MLMNYKCFLIYELNIRQNNLTKAVLVDMEEGVIGEMKRGPLGSLFDHNQLISSVSGSGNNWSALRLVANFVFFASACPA